MQNLEHMCIKMQNLEYIHFATLSDLHSQTVKVMSMRAVAVYSTII